MRKIPILSISAVLMLILFSIHAVYAQSSGPSMTPTMKTSNMTMNMMPYHITVNSTSYLVMVESNTILPKNIQFSGEQKSVVLYVSGLATRNLSYYEITIPPNLIKGDFTATLGGHQVSVVSISNIVGKTLQINIPSSFVKANGISDSAPLTITGTQAVPEFPSSVMIVMVITFGIISVLFARSNRFT